MTTPHFSLREYALAMARYNQWMNRKLYEAAAQLTEEDRKRDLHAFFGSVHRTLNHLLLGDQSWLQRLTGQPVTMTSPSQELHSDFEALRRDRELTDHRLIEWAKTLGPEQACGTLTFFSVTYQKHFSMPIWAAVMQVFNHETHHRGQITTLLNQMGVDVGITDLPAMPYWAELADTPATAETSTSA